MTIRELQIKDIEYVSDLWLRSTIDAHNFIAKEYWLDNYSFVKENCLRSAKTFVFEENFQIKGFISILENNFIGALFVDNECKRNGIGTALIECAKEISCKLTLAVYKENRNALQFYLKSGFTINSEQLNNDSGKPEYIMTWLAE